MNKYEGVYFLPDALKEDALEAALESVRNDIRKSGGEIREEKPVGRSQLTKPIMKQQSVFAVEIAFEIAPEKVSALRERHKLNGNILRCMIVRGKVAAAAAPAGEPAKNEG